MAIYDFRLSIYGFKAFVYDFKLLIYEFKKLKAFRVIANTRMEFLTLLDIKNY